MTDDVCYDYYVDYGGINDESNGNIEGKIVNETMQYWNYGIDVSVKSNFHFKAICRKENIWSRSILILLHKSKKIFHYILNWAFKHST